MWCSSLAWQGTSYSESIQAEWKHSSLQPSWVLKVFKYYSRRMRRSSATPFYVNPHNFSHRRIPPVFSFHRCSPVLWEMAGWFAVMIRTVATLPYMSQSVEPIYYGSLFGIFSSLLCKISLVVFTQYRRVLPFLHFMLEHNFHGWVNTVSKKVCLHFL